MTTPSSREPRRSAGVRQGPQVRPWGRAEGRSADLLICLALLAATFAAYAGVGGFGFLSYDDRAMVSENPRVTGGPTAENLRWAFGSGLTGNWHPLTWISYQVGTLIHGPGPAGYHLVNLLLHAANAVLLFLVLRRMTGARGPSAFVAGLFALHPLHVESVAWVAERKDLLSAFFWFAGIGAWALYVERPAPSRYLAVAALFAAGLMSKPMLVTFPFVLLLLDWWPLGRFHSGAPRALAADPGAAAGSPPGAAGRPTTGAGGGPGPGFAATLWPLVGEKLPLFALSALSSVVSFNVQRSAGAVTWLETWPLPDRLANALVSCARYLGKTIWPAGLAPFYPRVPAWPVWAVVGAAVLIAGVTALALREARRRPWLAVGWFWFLGTLVPVIGIVQVGMQAMADRYTYVPLVGIFIAVAWGAASLGKGSRLIGPAALALLAACGVATARQAGFWKDDVTLFTRDLAVAGDNAVAHNILGNALGERGELDGAIAHFRAAMRIVPSAATASNLGFALARAGDFHGAIEAYREAARLDPTRPRTLARLGEALDHEGRTGEAIEAYEASLRLDPAQAGIRSNLGVCLASMGRTEEAIAEYTEALHLAPGAPEVLNNLGAALESAARPGEALDRYREAVRLRPDYADAHLNLANLFLRTGRAADAAQEYRALLRLRPGDRRVEEALARALAAGGR